MNKKKYYAITTSMIFEKTVLVPADEVDGIDEAIDLVDRAVEICEIELLNDYAECKTRLSKCYKTDEYGICELTDEYAQSYQIINCD